MSTAVEAGSDFALFAALRRRLASEGVRAEVREHLMTLVVFRLSPALPICVFIRDGQFCCWGEEPTRVPVAELERVTAELARSLPDGDEPEPHPGSAPEDSATRREIGESDQETEVGQVRNTADTWQQVRADWVEFYAFDYDPTGARPYTARRHGSDLVITAESPAEMRGLLRADHERLTRNVR